MKNKWRQLATWVLGIMAVACAKEDIDPTNISLETYKPTLAIPLANSTLGIERILTNAENQDVLNIDQSGFVSLVYENNTFTYDIEELIELNDLVVSQQLENLVPTNIPVAVETTIVRNITVRDTLNLGGPIIDELFFSQGQLAVSLTENTDAEVSLDIDIPSLLQNGIPTQLNVNSSQGNDQVQLSNSVLDLGSSLSGDNIIDFNMRFEITYPIGSTIRTTDAFSFEIGLTDMDYQRVYCDLGQQQIDLPPDSVLINIFSGVQTDGQFRLTSPQIEIDFTNGLGVDFDMEFQQLYSRNEATGTINNVDVSNINSTFSLAGATTSGGTNQITPQTSTVVIDDALISEIITPTPKYITQDLLATLNPGPGPYTNFVDKQSSIDIKTRIIMPLEGYVGEFILRDTSEFNFGGLGDEIEELEIAVFSVNGFPAEATLQLYMMDSTNTVIDSLFDSGNKFILAGKTGNDGRVDQATERTANDSYVSVDVAKANNLKATRNLIIEAALLTEDAQNQNPVRIYNDYRLDIKVGLKIKTNIEF